MFLSFVLFNVLWITTVYNYLDDASKTFFTITDVAFVAHTSSKIAHRLIVFLISIIITGISPHRKVNCISMLILVFNYTFTISNTPIDDYNKIR